MDYLWQAPLRAARSEPDSKRLIELSCEVEELIFFRSQELVDSNGGSEEPAAIKAALQELLRIRVEKLGWPAVNLSRS